MDTSVSVGVFLIFTTVFQIATPCLVAKDHTKFLNSQEAMVHATHSVVARLEVIGRERSPTVCPGNDDPDVGVRAAEAWAAEGDVSSNVDVPYLDFKRD